MILGRTLSYMITGREDPISTTRISEPASDYRAAKHVPGWTEQPWQGPRKLSTSQLRVWKAALLFLDSVPDGPALALEQLLLHFGAQDDAIGPTKRSTAKQPR